MYKMIAIYKVPTDVNAFEDWYKGHMEIAKKVPNVLEFRLNKVTGGPRGASDLHLLTELVFATSENLVLNLKKILKLRWVLLKIWRPVKMHSLTTKILSLFILLKKLWLRHN